MKMEDSRRQYEYEEEKGVGGFLFVFLIMMIIIEILLGIFSTAAGCVFLKKIALLRNINLVVGITYIMYILFIMVALYNFPKVVIKSVKAFLIIRLAYLIPIAIVTYVRSFEDPFYNQGHTGIEAVLGTTLYALGIPVLYIVAFSTVWFIYFSKSKRVREAYLSIKK